MPDSGLSVIQVQYGERVTRKSVVLHDYQQYGQPDGDLQMDYNYWVIRSGDKTILLDTGYDISARDWLGEISVVPTPESLKLLGIDPASVHMVITADTGAEVIPGHDGRVRDRHPALDGPASHIATYLG